MPSHSDAHSESPVLTSAKPSKDSALIADASQAPDALDARNDESAQKEKPASKVGASSSSENNDKPPQLIKTIENASSLLSNTVDGVIKTLDDNGKKAESDPSAAILNLFLDLPNILFRISLKSSFGFYNFVDGSLREVFGSRGKSDISRSGSRDAEKEDRSTKPIASNTVEEGKDKPDAPIISNKTSDQVPQNEPPVLRKGEDGNKYSSKESYPPAIFKNSPNIPVFQKIQELKNVNNTPPIPEIKIQKNIEHPSKGR